MEALESQDRDVEWGHLRFACPTSRVSLQSRIHCGILVTPGALRLAFRERGRVHQRPEPENQAKLATAPRGIPTENVKRCQHSKQNRRDSTYSLLGLGKGSQMKCEEVSESPEETGRPF